MLGGENIQQGLNGKDKSGTNEYRKIHPLRNYSMHKEYQSVCPFVGIGPTHPLPRKFGRLPIWPKWEGDTLACWGGVVGGTQFKRLDRNSGTLCSIIPLFLESALVTVSRCLYKYSGSSLTIIFYYIWHGEQLFETKWRLLCTARFLLGPVLLVHGEVDEADRTHPPRLAVLPGQQPSHQPFQD